MHIGLTRSFFPVYMDLLGYVYVFVLLTPVHTNAFSFIVAEQTMKKNPVVTVNMFSLRAMAELSGNWGYFCLKGTGIIAPLAILDGQGEVRVGAQRHMSS